MTARGVHFALSPSDAERLLAAADDDGVAEVLEEIEERWERNWLAETDKAWDAIHRCLTDGTLDGRVPRSRALAVLGGRDLYEAEYSYAYYLSPTEVREADAAIRDIDEAWLRRRYETLRDTDYDGPQGDDDAEYTWSYFTALQKLFARAGREGRAMLFSVDD